MFFITWSLIDHLRNYILWHIIMAWFYSKFRSNLEYQKATLVLVLTTYEIPILFWKKKQFIQSCRGKKKSILYFTSLCYVRWKTSYDNLLFILPNNTYSPPKKTAPPNKKKILETLSWLGWFLDWQLPCLAPHNRYKFEKFGFWCTKVYPPKSMFNRTL